MKKMLLAGLLLAGTLSLTACGGPATYEKADPAQYLTLGDYKGLTYTAIDTSVSDYDLTVALNEKLSDSGYATYSEEDTTITEGTVQIGDTVNIDYTGTKDGVAFDGGSATGQSLTIGSGSFIDGFEEGLVGVAIGDTVDLNLTFPENYGSEELAGQAVVFEVTVNSVTERVTYPTLTDELANTLNSELNTAEEYLAELTKELEESNQSDAESDIQSILWNKTIENATFTGELPEKLLAQAEEEFVNYYTTVASQYSYDNLEDFLTANNITTTSFESRTAQYAESIVKSQLTAYAIAKAEGYTVTEEDYTAAVEEYAAAAGYSSADQYIEAVGEDAIRDQVVLDYAVDLVVENSVAAA